MWEQGFSSRLKQMQTEYPEVVSCEYLDKYMDKITYTSRKYTKKVTPNNSVILTIAADAFPPEVEVKIFDDGWWKRLDDIVKRPARGVWLEHKGAETNYFALVFQEATTEVITKNIEKLKTACPPLRYVIKIETYSEVQKKQETTEMSGSIVEYMEFDGFQMVTKRKRCKLEKNCKEGDKCLNRHNAEEKAYFKKHDGKGNPGRKTEMCRKFQKGTCYFQFDPKKFDYVHKSEEKWCLECLKTAGHFETECPSKKLR